MGGSNNLPPASGQVAVQDGREPTLFSYLNLLASINCQLDVLDSKVFKALGISEHPIPWGAFVIRRIAVRILT